jgi:hypothetical protein
MISLQHLVHPQLSLKNIVKKCEVNLFKCEKALNFLSPSIRTGFLAKTSIPKDWIIMDSMKCIRCVRGKQKIG